MSEAVGRHASRVEAGDIEPADLIVIDGGVGQLEAARKAAAGTRSSACRSWASRSGSRKS